MNKPNQPTHDAEPKALRLENEHAPTVHPTAVVHPTATLGSGVTVGPYAVVGQRVTVGARSALHNHATVLGPAVIGEDNEVFPYAVLGAEPQDLKYKGHDTALVVGDRNKFREHSTVHRGTQFGDAATRIGSDCLLMVGAHVAHDCRLDDEVVIANNTMIGGHCHLEFGSTVAGGSGIHHFTTIARLAFVGGMSRISKDVPPFCIVEGNPAQVRKVNSVALARRRFPIEQVEALRAALRLLFRSSDLTTLAAIEQIRGEAHSPENRDAQHAFQPALELCAFLERCDTGVHGRYLEAERQDYRRH